MVTNEGKRITLTFLYLVHTIIIQCEQQQGFRAVFSNHFYRDPCEYLRTSDIPIKKKVKKNTF